MKGTQSMSRKDLNRKYDKDYEEINYHTQRGIGWLFKVIIGLSVLILVLSALSMVVKPVFLYGDRIITKTSFQYTEGKAQEMLTLHTDYTGLGSRIAQAYVDNQHNLAKALEIQQAAIKTQMCNVAQIATTKSAIPDVVRSTCGI